MLCNDGYTPLLSLFPCHCWSFKGGSSEAAAPVHINKPGTNQHASTSLLGRLLQKRNVSLQTVQMLSNAGEWGRRAVWGQTEFNRDGDKKNEQSGEKKDKTRGGIKGSALMQSSAHLSSAGVATTSSPAITLSFQTEALRGGASAASSQRGTNPILNLIHKIVHESVAQSKREKLKNDLKHI